MPESSATAEVLAALVTEARELLPLYAQQPKCQAIRAADAVVERRHPRTSWEQFWRYILPLRDALGSKVFYDRVYYGLRKLAQDYGLSEAEIERVRSGDYLALSDQGQRAMAVLLRQQLCRYIALELMRR